MDDQQHSETQRELLDLASKVQETAKRLNLEQFIKRLELAMEVGSEADVKLAKRSLPHLKALRQIAFSFQAYKQLF